MQYCIIKNCYIFAQVQDLKTSMVASEAPVPPKSSIPLSPVRSIAPKQQVKVVNLTAIDNAIKTVLTEVQTSLPTAQIKVSSPFATQTRNVTITTSAMKSPIPAVPPVEALSTSPTKTHPVSTLKGSLVAPSMIATLGVNSQTAGAPQLSQTQQSPTAGSAAAAGKLPAMLQQGVLGSGKNVVLKMLPGGIQAVVSPPAGSAGEQLHTQEGKTLQQTLLTAGQQQAKIGQKSQQQPQQQVQSLMLQMGKSGTLQLVAVTSGSQTSAITSGPQIAGISSVTQNPSAPINPGNPPLTTQNKKEQERGVGVTEVSTPQSEPSTVKVKNTESNHVPKLANVSKISSQPYTKPQTIQQLIESKAKGPSGSSGQQMKVIRPAGPSPNVKAGVSQTVKPTVVMPGSVSGSGVAKVEASTTKPSDGAVRVVQPSAVIPSVQQPAAGHVVPPAGQVALTTAAQVTTTPITNVSTASNAGPTMAAIMANIGGRSLT